MKKIGIVGVGWLGEKLLKPLSDRGIAVVGTVSSLQKADQLSNRAYQINSFVLGEPLHKLVAFRNLDAILITIPPSSHKAYDVGFEKLIEYLADENKKAVFIYTSSTSIYGDRTGEVDELTRINPQSQNAIKIKQVEEFLQKKIPNKVLILRLAGLVGDRRNPIHYLSGRSKIPKPLSPVNLVHREDVVDFILFLLDKGLRKGVFNLCCKEHPAKAEYYSWIAQKMKLPIPTFDLEDKSKGKTIVCNALTKIGFELKYNSPYNFPNEEVG